MFLLAWLTAIAITVHNLEEMIALPAWSHGADRFMKPLDAGEFRFAAGLISLFALALPCGASLGYRPDLLLHLMAGFAFAMIINTVAPHLFLTLATRSYMPGLGSGLLLVAPISVSFLLVMQMRFIEMVVWGAGVGALLILAIPLLYGIKRRFLRDRRVYSAKVNQIG